MLTWSPQQETALRAIEEWLKGSSPTFILKGVAGSGKSSLMKYVAQMLEAEGQPVHLLAPTGKAMCRLADVVGMPAKTIHKALYQPFMKDGELHFSKTHVEYPGVAIVDESSMISSAQANDLSYAFSKVLYVGDPFQLPPVKQTDWFGLQPATAELTEVHRQALDSAVLRLATKLRSGGSINLMDAAAGQVRLVTKLSVPWLKMAQSPAPPQIICGTNRSRSMILRGGRPEPKSKGEWLAPGERVLCKRNVELALGPSSLQYIPNGAQLTVASIAGKLISLTMDDGTALESVKFNPALIEQHYTPVTPVPEWSTLNKTTLFLDLAACITVHAAQGSEWDSVLVYDDIDWMKDAIDKARWRYTAVTRAAKELIYAL